MTSSHRLGRIFLPDCSCSFRPGRHLILAALFERWTRSCSTSSVTDPALCAGVGHPVAHRHGAPWLEPLLPRSSGSASSLAETTLEGIPLIRSIYLTLKSMTDLSELPRALRTKYGGGVPVSAMGSGHSVLSWASPQALQVAPTVELVMVFVPTAIHPFTGYLAMIPKTQLQPLNLLPGRSPQVGIFSGALSPPPGLAHGPAVKSS